MKNSVYEQFAIVKEDTASLFTAKLNEQVYALREYSPVVTFSDADPLCAYIKYVARISVPETLSEEYEAQGVRFICSQCPFFKPATKDDGSEDKRCKWGECEHAEFGRTYKTSAACDKLYELIKEGDVKLCFMD